MGITGLVILIRLRLGGTLSAVEIYLGCTVVALLVIRQMITLLENTVLLQRVSDGQRRMTYQALHDPLTGLANRTLFSDLLARAIERHARDGRQVALLFIDLDDFKLVNDSLGHSAGDRALGLVGRRLASHVRETDVVARLGGDEFAILIEGNVEDPEAVGERILAAMREPLTVDGRLLAVSASVGVASSDADRSRLNPDALLRRADAAMYAAKDFGKGALVHYRAGVTHGLHHPDLPNLLAEALHGDPKNAGFTVAYQPVVRMEDETTVAVEALARWSHPVSGVVGPDVFVAVAERAGLIAAVDNFVLDQACHDAAALTESYGRPIDIHVNASARRLGQPELEAAIIAALERYAVAPSRLVVEITETARIGDLAAASAGAARLRRLGVRLALDDFGAGFNAMAQLHALPVDIVKLDREIARLDPDPQRAEAMCRAIVTICESIGVVVIAEGVETRAQSVVLERLGVTLAQGYLYGEPTALPELAVAVR
ncbi:MAG: diguanylate cyclase [Micromonosporaceae bacterium]|nr:diguanylate cyclase [Micromonosporaceae bacterium]